MSPFTIDSEEQPFIDLKSSNSFRMPRLKTQVSVTAVARQADPEEAAQQFVARRSASASPDAFETEGNRNATQPAAVQSLSVPECSGGHDHKMTHHSGVDHSQHFLNRSQGQPAAGDLDAHAVKRAIPDREGLQEHAMAQTHPTRNCRGVLLDDGKWRAQIKVEGDMQLLGLFDNKEDAAQAYAVARRQKLLVHVL